jgi:hypothetical protein
VIDSVAEDRDLIGRIESDIQSHVPGSEVTLEPQI